MFVVRTGLSRLMVDFKIIFDLKIIFKKNHLSFSVLIIFIISSLIRCLCHFNLTFFFILNFIRGATTVLKFYRTEHDRGTNDDHDHDDDLDGVLLLLFMVKIISIVGLNVEKMGLTLRTIMCDRFVTCEILK